MATAALYEGLRTEREETLTTPSYDEWTTATWNVTGSSFTDLSPTTDSLTFYGDGTGDSYCTMIVSRTSGGTTTLVGWGSRCTYSSSGGTFNGIDYIDSVSLEHIDPLHHVTVTLTIRRTLDTISRKHVLQTDPTTQTWSHRGRKISGGSWTAVEG